MRIIFMGTPDFARDILDALLLAPELDVIAVYSQPPRAGGRRGRELVPSVVQVRAEGSEIPVFTPTSLRKAEAQAAFAALDADVAVVAAYGLILPQTILDAPRYGCLNVHGSLLPRWRGAAPVQRAILAGDAETGVGIMQMEAGLDTGPVRLEGRTPVAGKTTGDLTRELAAMGGRLMVQVLGDLDAYPARPQPEDGVTYAAKIDKAQARIDFSAGAVEVERLVRAMNPAPGAWLEVAGERVKVLACEICDITGAVTTHHPSERGNLPLVGHSPTDLGPDFRGDDRVMDYGIVLDSQLTIACRDGAIRPSLVQRAGRGVTSTEELLRGFPIPAGTRL